MGVSTIYDGGYEATNMYRYLAEDMELFAVRCEHTFSPVGVSVTELIDVYCHCCP